MTTTSDQLEQRLHDLHRELYGPVNRHLYDRTLEALGQELCETLFGFSLGSELGLNGCADMEAECCVTSWVEGLRDHARRRGLLSQRTCERAGCTNTLKTTDPEVIYCGRRNCAVEPLPTTPPLWARGRDVMDLNAPPRPVTFGEAWASGARCYRCGEQVPESDRAEIVVHLDGVDRHGIPTTDTIYTHVIVHASTCRREGDVLA